MDSAAVTLPLHTQEIINVNGAYWIVGTRGNAFLGRWGYASLLPLDPPLMNGTIFNEQSSRMYLEGGISIAAAK
jgi:hypothetical protein